MNDAGIEWGDTKEDVDYVCGVLTEIRALADRAAVDDYAADRAAFEAALRGQATMLGLAIPAREDVVETLTAILTAARDAEGERSEAIIATARGKVGAEKSAIHRAASAHSARRGWLDSAVYAIRRGMEKLAELLAWEARRAA